MSDPPAQFESMGTTAISNTAAKRLRRAAASLLGLMLLVLASPAIAAPETLSVMTNCPLAGEHQACLRVRVFRLGPATTADRRAHDWDATRAVLLKGHVLGTAPDFFRLKIENPAYLWQGANDLGPVAYLGRSQANRPVILTSAGPFEILSPQFDVDKTPEIIVIDEPNWKVVAEYVKAQDVAWVVTAPDRIAVFDIASGACMSAPQSKPGLLQLRPHACDNAEATSSGVIPEGSISGNLETPPIPDPIPYDPFRIEERLAELKIGGPGEPRDLIAVRRIRGTTFVIAKTAPVETPD